jgi:hypothetical protein
MGNERPEFRPIETAPARKVWPYAVMGAIIAGLLIWIARHEGAQAQPKQVALATVAPKIDPPQPEAKPAIEPLVDKAKEPNVLGTVGKLAMVARAELDRELGRTRAAQKQSEAYRKQIGALEKELTEARAQIAALQRAKQGPPPSDQEQILQMLAPVLRTSNP